MIALMTSLILIVIIISLACIFIANRQLNHKNTNQNPNNNKQRQKQHNKIRQTHIRNVGILCDQLRQLDKIKKNLSISYSLYKQILYIKTKMYNQTNLTSIFTILEKQQKQKKQFQQLLMRSDQLNQSKEKQTINKEINKKISLSQLHDNKIITKNNMRCFQEIFLNNLTNRIMICQDQLLAKVKQITRIMRSEILIVKVKSNNNSIKANKLMNHMIKANYLELKDLLMYNVNLKQKMQRLNVQIDNLQQKLISDRRQLNNSAKYQTQYNEKSRILNGRQLKQQNRQQQQYNNSRIDLYNNHHKCFNYNHKEISQTIKQSLDIISQTLSFLSFIIQNHLLQIDTRKLQQLIAQSLCFSNRSDFQRQPIQTLTENIQTEVKQLSCYYFNQQKQLQSQAFTDSNEIKQLKLITNQQTSHKANQLPQKKQQNQGQLNPISSDLLRQLNLLINHLNLANKQNFDAFSNRLLNQYQFINDRNQFQSTKTTTLQQLINAYQQQLSTINSKRISIKSHIDKHTRQFLQNDNHFNQNNKIKIYKTQQNTNQSQDSQKPSNYNQKQQQNKKINQNFFNEKQLIQTGQQIFSVSNRMKFIKQLDKLMVRNRIKKEHQELERKIKLKEQQQIKQQLQIKEQLQIKQRQYKQQHSKQIYQEKQQKQFQQQINRYQTKKFKEQSSK